MLYWEKAPLNECKRQELPDKTREGGKLALKGLVSSHFRRRNVYLEEKERTPQIQKAHGQHARERQVDHVVHTEIA